MPTRVEDVMTRDVVAVEEETAYKDIVEVMHRQHVAAVPVLDHSGQVRGVVSETDLLIKEADPDAADEVHLSPSRRAEQRKAMAVQASDLMTAPPVMVPAAAPVEDAARLMRRHRINQVVVIDAVSGRLRGIVGRRDVLGVYRRPDADIERDIREQVITGEFAIPQDRIAVTVKDGRATLTGKAERRSLIPLLLRSVRYVEGVVSATSRMEYKLDDSYPQGPYL